MALAADINPGVYFGSNPRDIVDIGSDRILVADDGFSGEEVFRLIETAPVVESVTINDGNAQRSSIETVRVTFDSEVELTGDPFTFSNTTLSETLTHVASVTVQEGKTVVDFTFAPGPSVNANGLLLDGDYQLVVDASQVNSLALGLDGNGDGAAGDNFVFGAQAADNFFRKYGDSDGNNVVNLDDFAAFRATFGLAAGDPAYNDAMDADGGDMITLDDFAAFRANFGT